MCPHIDKNVNLARFSRTDKNVHAAHFSYSKISIYQKKKTWEHMQNKNIMSIALKNVNFKRSKTKIDFFFFLQRIEQRNSG